MIPDRMDPRQVDKTPPCTVACAAGGDVRGWISVVAQRRKLGISNGEAYARAWNMIAAVNPFPATLGRICPHPCESGCTRQSHDGAIAINALERFLGDWALRRHLALPVLDTHAQPESIGVIGAGPAGLSFAYQMTRRGYRVTVYDKRQQPGGMLTHAIPSFRLPRAIVDAEVRRIFDLGVQSAPHVAIGRDVSLQELRRRHSVLFIGIGAERAIPLDIPGARGDGVWSGLDYLSAMKAVQPVHTGPRVVVIGGGNTAVDAARVARRTGADVIVLYRRTRAEMRANRTEIDAALAEGVRFEYLALPMKIERRGGSVIGVVAQRVRPATTEAASRHQCNAVERRQFTLAADCVIAAISQEADWSHIEELRLPEGIAAAELGTTPGILIYAGGDVLEAGIAGFAIEHGRRAAESVHAKLRGSRRPDRVAPANSPSACLVKAEYYAQEARACVASVSVEQRFVEPDRQVEQTLSEPAFLHEVARCFSCGQCFGCERCFMYCSAAAFNRLKSAQPGAYFALDTDRCEGCGKCIELCPSGFLSPASQS